MDFVKKRIKKRRVIFFLTFIWLKTHSQKITRSELSQEWMSSGSPVSPLKHSLSGMLIINSLPQF